MVVNLAPPKDILPVPGIRLAAASTGRHASGRNDVLVLHCCEGTKIAGVYTQSAFAAPPIHIARDREPSATTWVVNSGNANAATGEPGANDARIVCDAVAKGLGIDAGSVQPFSTGVIGERLDVVAVSQAAGQAIKQLSADAWIAAASAIMTTDTVAKAVSHQFVVAGQIITVTGIAKGSGMIKPNMATMLAFIGCDADIPYAMLQALTKDIANASFNRITVDGDTSTNDAMMIAATGQQTLPSGSLEQDDAMDALRNGLLVVAQQLAQAIVRDGEGATKFVTIRVSGADDADEALCVAYTVAESPLVKTALFAGDANWGRFCMAIGRAEVANLDPAGVSLWLNDVQVAQGGMMAASYSEAAGAKVLAEDEFVVAIDLGRGDAAETIWTTDLSYEYIRINAEYRS